MRAIRTTIALLWKPVAAAIAVSLFGSWQYHRGFNNGADSAICAFAVGLNGATAIETMDACKNITDRNWIVDGFDPHKKGSAK